MYLITSDKIPIEKLQLTDFGIFDGEIEDMQNCIKSLMQIILNHTDSTTEFYDFFAYKNKICKIKISIKINDTSKSFIFTYSLDELINKPIYFMINNIYYYELVKND